MKYTEQLWFLLFEPGTRECIVGYSDNIIRNYDNVDDDDNDNGDDNGKDNGKDTGKDEDNGNDIGKEDDNGDDTGKDDDDDDDDDDDEETYRKMAEEAMAQAFNVTLEQEVSRGMGEWVESTKKLGGWTATTLESNMEYTQFAETILTLSPSHLAFHRFAGDVLRSLGRH
jgi:hypothetical protein